MPVLLSVGFGRTVTQDAHIRKNNVYIVLESSKKCKFRKVLCCSATETTETTEGGARGAKEEVRRQKEGGADAPGKGRGDGRRGQRDLATKNTKCIYVDCQEAIR